MRRRNILVIITDQQTAAAMSCADNPWLHTPAMDRLAARGLRCARAYCSYPLCTPARMSQMTGMHPHQMGVNGNAGKFFWYHDVPRERFMGHHFARAGYQCVWAGKDMPPEDGSRDFELLCPWGDVQTADHMVRFLQGEHERPFLAVANFVNPHNICEFARNVTLFEGGIGEEPPLAEMPLLPANHLVPPYEPEILRVIQSQGAQCYAAARYQSPDQWRRYLWAYYRMVEKVDRQIGRIVDALDASGRGADTLVWFCSDHGDGCAAHRWNQKQCHYEEVIRVPTIIVAAGVPAARIEQGLVASSLDLMPTCLDFAGLPIPEGLEGSSLLPLARADAEAKPRKALVVESALDPERGERAAGRNRGRMLVTERFKYTAWAWGEHRECLTDLVADPGEMVNLAVSLRYRQRLVEMRAELQAWCLRTGDTFAVPGHETLGPQAGHDEMGTIRSRDDASEVPL